MEKSYDRFKKALENMGLKCSIPEGSFSQMVSVSLNNGKLVVAGATSAGKYYIMTFPFLRQMLGIKEFDECLDKIREQALRAGDGKYAESIRKWRETGYSSYPKDLAERFARTSSPLQRSRLASDVIFFEENKRLERISRIISPGLPVDTRFEIRPNNSELVLEFKTSSDLLSVASVFFSDIEHRFEADELLYFGISVDLLGREIRLRDWYVSI